MLAKREDLGLLLLALQGGGTALGWIGQLVQTAL
jgi:hypothetical protein